MTTPNNNVALLLRAIDEAFDKKSWHGTNLRGSIRGLDAEQASWRPTPKRHNIWELVVHAAYWKYVVRRKLLGEARGSFPVKGSNWIPRPEPGRAIEERWKADVKLLADMHRDLRAAVAALDADALHIPKAGKETSTLSLVMGIAAHDLYHAGQIQLLKRLHADAS